MKNTGALSAKFAFREATPTALGDVTVLLEEELPRDEVDTGDAPGDAGDAGDTGDAAADAGDATDVADAPGDKARAASDKGLHGCMVVQNKYSLV